MLAGVMHVHRISSPYKLAGRGFRPEGTVVEFANGVKLGGERVLRHGRAMLHREPRPDVRNRKAGKGVRRHISARRGIQAAQLALFLPGHGHSRARS